jgi:hypothetical protein
VPVVPKKIGRRLRGGFRSDGAACTAAVFDIHLLAQRLGELLGDQAADDIGVAARRERHDQLDRPGGIRLRNRASNQREKQDRSA